METIVRKVFPTVSELRPFTQPSSAEKNSISQSPPKRNTRRESKYVKYEYRCPIPGCIYEARSERFFVNIAYLKQHYKKVHAEKCHVCPKCSKGYHSNSSLKAHEAVCGTIFRCDCGVSYPTLEALQTHCKRKGHSLLDAYARPRATPKSVASLKQNDATTLLTSSKLLPPVPTVLVIIGRGGTQINGNAIDYTMPTANQSTMVRPCFILPKSAPLHSVPLPTVAAMALSELGSRVPTAFPIGGATTESATQTDEVVLRKCRSVGCSPLKRMPADVGRKYHLTTRRTPKRSAETQTARQTTTRKRPRRTSRRCCGTQTFVPEAPLVSEQTPPPSMTHKLSSPEYSFEEAGTQTLALYCRMIDSIAHEMPSGCGGDWSLSDMAFAGEGGGSAEHEDGRGSSSSTIMDNNKFCQTIEELEVDINFQLSSGAAVSSATQTSPRVRLQQRQQGLLSSLRGLLTSMGEAEERNFVASTTRDHDRFSSFVSEESAEELGQRGRRLSSHTQTNDALDQLLLVNNCRPTCASGADGDSDDEGEAVGGIMSCTDIHTQTTEGDLLEDIPYEQLLSSHMETQTTDEDALLFSELSVLCDIQTQTNLCDYGSGDEDLVGYRSSHLPPNVADIHTQTPQHSESYQLTSSWRLPAQTNHTETQTFPSLLDICCDAALTDSHTQTPGNWTGDFNDVQLLFP